MTVALIEMSREALLREVKLANHRRDHFRVAVVKRELVRRRVLLETEQKRLTSVK